MKKLLASQVNYPPCQREGSLYLSLGSQLGPRLFPPATLMLESKAAEIITRFWLLTFDCGACAQFLSSARIPKSGVIVTYSWQLLGRSQKVLLVAMGGLGLGPTPLLGISEKRWQYPSSWSPALGFCLLHWRLMVKRGLGKETGVYELKKDSGRADDEKAWNPNSHSKSNRQELLITGRWKLG